MGEGIAGYVAKTGRVVRVKDAYRDKRFLRQWDDLTGYKTRSILAAPMKNHVGRTIGVIQVLNKNRGEGEFSQHDEELLSALATQAAVSIDNSRLFLSVIQKNMQLVETKEQLEHRVADLKLLFELETAMSGAATMEELARAVVAEAARACDARAGALLVDEQEAGVWLYFVDRWRRPGPTPAPSRRRRRARRRESRPPASARRRARARGQARRGQAQRGLDRLGDGAQRGHLPAAGRGAARRRRRRPGVGARRADAPPLGRLGDRGAARGRGRRGRGRHRALQLAQARRLLSGRSRAAPPGLGQRLHRGAPLPLPPRARAQRAAHHHRPPPLRRDARHAHAAHRDQRLRAAHGDRRGSGAARRPRAPHPQAVRPHQRDAARGARVRPRRAQHPGAQGLPDQVLRRHRQAAPPRARRHRRRARAPARGPRRRPASTSPR